MARRYDNFDYKIRKEKKNKNAQHLHLKKEKDSQRPDTKQLKKNLNSVS